MEKNTVPIVLTLLTLIFTAAFIYLFYAAAATGIGPEQPIPFSHNVHNGIKQIQCQYCHPYVGYSNHPGVPPVEKCLHCHNYIIATSTGCRALSAEAGMMAPAGNPPPLLSSGGRQIFHAPHVAIHKPAPRAGRRQAQRDRPGSRGPRRRDTALGM